MSHMLRASRSNSCLASLSAVVLLCFHTHVAIAAPPICDTLLACAQQAVDAALRAETAVAVLRKQISELETRRVEGNRVLCSLRWDEPGSTSVAQCKDDEELTVGGCSMTCLDMAHLEAIPVGENNRPPRAWSCHQGPFAQNLIDADKNNAPPRSFAAIAFCRKKLAE
jgi:hypothetical protein